MRIDEFGIKFAITIDPGTLKDQQITVRNRDGMIQKRIKIDDIVDYMGYLDHRIKDRSILDKINKYYN